MKKNIVVGTRGSRLALIQCYQAIADIQDISKVKYGESVDSQFKVIITTGDKMQGTAGAESLTKTAWVDKIEEALLNKTINVAIHSGKDIPKDIAQGTKLIPIGKRNSPFDVFIGKLKDGKRIKFQDLQIGASIGTASLRRGLFLKKSNNSYNIVPHRGNVPTRISKLDESKNLDGIILAAAGINRLNMNCDYEELSYKNIVPSALQGTLVAQIREDDTETENLVNRMLDKETEICFNIERKISEYLGADCKSCVGIYAYIENTILKLIISAISPITMKKNELIKEIELQKLDITMFLDEINNSLEFKEIVKIVNEK